MDTNHLFEDELAMDDRREARWLSSPWRHLAVGVMGLALLGATFVTPRSEAVYLNWGIGFIATMAAFAMSGNRKWERPAALAAGIWLFISGFDQGLIDSGGWVRSDLIVGAVLVISAISAMVHMRQDVIHHRPMAM